MKNISSTNHTSIYKLLFILFFAGVCNLQFKCNAQEYSKLDEVPQWVKEKVSPEEYKLWEVMSSVFQIDYSFLKKIYLKKEEKKYFTSCKTLYQESKMAHTVSRKVHCFV